MTGQGSKSNQSSNPRIQSFIEQLRQRSGAPTIPSEENDQSPFSFESYRQEKELQESRKQEFFQYRKREFNEVYSLHKNREAKRIEEIHQRIIQLSVSVQKFNQEVRVAAIQTVTNPGKSDESIFDQILNLIETIKKRVDNSSSWLNLYNSRSKKKGYYWGMASQKGTKFTYAEERQVATSIG